MPCATAAVQIGINPASAVRIAVPALFPAVMTPNIVWRLRRVRYWRSGDADDVAAFNTSIRLNGTPCVDAPDATSDRWTGAKTSRYKVHILFSDGNIMKACLARARPCRISCPFRPR